MHISPTQDQIESLRKAGVIVPSTVTTAPASSTAKARPATKKSQTPGKQTTPSQPVAHTPVPTPSTTHHADYSFEKFAGVMAAIIACVIVLMFVIIKGQ